METKNGIVCPACGGEGKEQKCKVFCSKCRVLIYNCSEF